MKIIRDEEGLGIFMIPLFVDWNVRRCNVEDCVDTPTTIAQGLRPDIPLAGFCEKHFQQANTEGGVKFNLIFDNFDAFKASRAIDTEARADADGAAEGR